MRYLDDLANAAEVRTASNAYKLSQDQGQPEPAAWGFRHPDQSNRRTTRGRHPGIRLGRVVRLAPVDRNGFSESGFVRIVESPRFANV